MNTVLDQYNQPLPDDLVLLDQCDVSSDSFHPINLSEQQIKAINDLDWYCLPGNVRFEIFVSLAKLSAIFTKPFDVITPNQISKRINFWKIDRVLHRFNRLDGFYWA